jgi:hypothetical protein
MIIVSYADTEYGHVGKVYQASNFIYTGLSAKRNNYVDGTDRHARQIKKTDQIEERSRKHRYIYINANKRDKKIIMSALKYPVEPYPQGTPSRYEINYHPVTQGSLL